MNLKVVAPLIKDTNCLYSDIPWAEQHFVEFSKLSTTYYDFITWRRDDFTGDTINIKDGVRLTKGTRSQNWKDINYYFFGGSTTWGTGVDDANTYPSLFSKRTNSEVLNLENQAILQDNHWLI